MPLLLFAPGSPSGWSFFPRLPWQLRSSVYLESSLTRGKNLARSRLLYCLSWRRKLTQPKPHLTPIFLASSLPHSFTTHNHQHPVIFVDDLIETFSYLSSCEIQNHNCSFVWMQWRFRYYKIDYVWMSKLYRQVTSTGTFKIKIPLK